MPVDWKKLVNESGEQTKKEFSAEISNLTALTNHAVDNLISETTISREDFAKVISVVKDATLSNEKKAKAIGQIDKGVNLLVGIAKRLL